MTHILRRIVLTSLTLASLALPLSSAAFGGEMSWDPADTGGVFQTPVRMRGAYLWVTPLSRRAHRMQLRQERQTRRMLLMHTAFQRK